MSASSGPIRIVDGRRRRTFLLLKSLSDDFEITALSTSRRESAAAAGKLFGVPLAFDNHQELVNSADVDVVAVTVKVPHHLELATGDGRKQDHDRG